MAGNRARLSLAELGEFDDFLTDALVDKVYYWTKIRKTKRLYLPNRRIAEQDVAPIVASYVVRARSVTAAVEKFEQLSGVKVFLQAMEAWKQNEFLKHVRRYMQIYHPEAPFEVNSTNRYTLDTHEACVHARRSIRTGETIKFLAGCMLLMTDEEEASLDDNSDFSVICTSRMKGTSVLLGPARFVNHDCDPNCKFITTNKENITIMAIRNIEMGEEITIKYADDYFGEKNCECLCQTCESRAQNGFAPLGGKTETTTAELVAVLEKDSGAYSFRLGRRGTARVSVGSQPILSRSVSTPGQQESEPQLPVNLSRKRGLTPMESALTPPLSEAGPMPEDEPRREPQLAATMNTPEVTPPPDVAKDAAAEVAQSVPSNPLTLKGASETQYSDKDDSDCDSELSEIDEEEYQKLLEMFSPSISTKYKNKRKRAHEDVQSPSHSLKRTKASSAKPEITLQGLNQEKKIKRKRDPEEYQPPPKRSKPQMPNPFKPSSKRTPGDSARSQKTGLECSCTDCGQIFWNPETWFVPMSCNRCLRHSKIYGLRWPKTFKRKNDQELEVQDPREISRFMTVAELNRLEKRQKEEEEAAKRAKGRRVSGGRKNTTTGEDSIAGAMTGRITKKKGSEPKERGGSHGRDKRAPAATIFKEDVEDGKENISDIVLNAKVEEKASAPAEVPVINNIPTMPHKALAEGKTKKVGRVRLSTGGVAKTDVAVDGRVTKKQAPTPRARAQPKMKTVSIGFAPVPAPSLPVGEA